MADTETKVIYAGVATAAALLGAKSFGGGKVCPPPATGAQTSTVGQKRPRDENVDKMAKPTEDTQIKDSRTGKVMSLPSGVTKVAAVAGVLSAASTVAAVSDTPPRRACRRDPLPNRTSSHVFEAHRDPRTAPPGPQSPEANLRPSRCKLIARRSLNTPSAL